MASGAGSSASAGEDVEGYASGYVQPRSNCPHLLSLSSPLHPSYPSMGSPCHSCGSLQENWVCLTCQTVECGRYINGHMLAHSRSTEHAIAVSYSDLSIWCFKCDAYLHAQANPQLRSIFVMLYRMKFGEAPLVQSEAVATPSEGEGSKSTEGEGSKSHLSSSAKAPVDSKAKHDV